MEGVIRMPDIEKANRPMQVYLPREIKKAFYDKLEEEYDVCPSRSKVIRAWVEAYIDGRLRIEERVR
jgi:hypothetical protein